MTTEKTAKEWFEMLKEPYRSQAIKASEEHSCPEKQTTYMFLSDAIVMDFWWYLTELDYKWHEVVDSLERGETTYLAEPPKS